MFYMKEVRVLLSEAARQRCGSALGKLEQNLRQEGIECRAEEQRYPSGKNSEGILWVTDLAEAAERLTAEGCAVLAYLHEGNRQESFAMCRYLCESLEETDAAWLERVYRRCKGLPWEILRTRHCLVRETTVADVEDFYRIYREPSVTEYMDRLYENPEEERAYARDYIEQVYGFYQFGIWTVEERESGEVIGRAGICYREGYEEPELGFVIGVPWQGRGYATEVCREILRYAYEEFGFERVLAFVQPENLASMRVCDKLGMEKLGEVIQEGRRYEVKIFTWQVTE